jgi:hypothetical protein
MDAATTRGPSSLQPTCDAYHAPVKRQQPEIGHMLQRGCKQLLCYLPQPLLLFQPKAVHQWMQSIMRLSEPRQPGVYQADILPKRLLAAPLCPPSVHAWLTAQAMHQAAAETALCWSSVRWLKGQVQPPAAMPTARLDAGNAGCRRQQNLTPTTPPHTQAIWNLALRAITCNLHTRRDPPINEQHVPRPSAGPDCSALCSPGQARMSASNHPPVDHAPTLHLSKIASCMLCSPVKTARRVDGPGAEQTASCWKQ